MELKIEKASENHHLSACVNDHDFWIEIRISKGVSTYWIAHLVEWCFDAESETLLFEAKSRKKSCRK